MSKSAKRERQRQNRELRREAEAQVARRRRTFKSVRNVGVIVVIIVAIVLLMTSGGSDDEGATTVSAKIERNYDAAPSLTIDPANTYVATVDTTEGSFEMLLDVEQAPVTVNSFVFLARNKFYDGLRIHRIVTDFVLQGGDPNGDGSGGPGYRLTDEPPVDGYAQYSVAMANSGPGTSGSQFFVVSTPAGATTLNGSGPPYKFSVLGRVTSGFATIARINDLGSPSQAGTPTKRVVITRIRVAETPDQTAQTTTAPPAP